MAGGKREGAVLAVEGPDEGNYRIEWFDTATGESLGRDSQPARPQRHFGRGIELKPPPFHGDVAARILRQGLDGASK